MDRQPTAGSVQRGLAALTIALLPLGNLWTVEAMGRSFPIPLAWIPAALLVIHFVLTSLSGLPDAWAELRQWPPILSALLAVALVLSLSLVLSATFWSGLAAYLNFVVGAFGGAAVGWTWATARRDALGAIDVAVLVFLAVGSLQVLLNSFALQDGQRVAIAWGGSNFVAAVLVTGSLLMVARLRVAGPVGWLWYVIPLAAMAAAMSTLSRGAAVALAAGGIVLLWNLGSTDRTRLVLRAACTVVPVLAIGAVGVFTYQRTLVNQQALVNITARFDLISLAWDEFLANPVFGTGWASLRASTSALGAETTFAHNFVLSFMQLGGIAGLVFVALMCVLLARVLKVGGVLAAPVASAMATALFDPFLESFIGGLLTFACAVLVLAQRQGATPAGISA
jgi:hypothetical protein